MTEYLDPICKIEKLSYRDAIKEIDNYYLDWGENKETAWNAFIKFCAEEEESLTSDYPKWKCPWKGNELVIDL